MLTILPSSSSSSSSSSIATNCWNPSQNKPLGPNRWQVEAKKLISLWFVIWKFLCNLSARNLNITQWWRQRGSCCWSNFYSDEFTWWRGRKRSQAVCTAYLSAGSQNKEHDWAEIVCLHGRTYVHVVLSVSKRVQPLRSKTQRERERAVWSLVQCV